MTQHATSVETFDVCTVAIEDLLLTSAVPVLVDISTTSCPPCEQLAALLPAIGRRFDEVLRIVQIDADAERAFIDQWAVRSFPTLLLFRAGALVDRQHGFRGYSALVRWIAEHTANTRESPPAAAEQDPFELEATKAEAQYQTATYPAAEALGRVIGSAFEQHEALVAALQSDREAGTVTAEAAQQAIRQSHAALLVLGAPELAQQRQVTRAALDRYAQDIERAAALLPQSLPSSS